MSRPLRISYSGACYHIINRGNRRENIFLQEEDYVLFIEKLVYFAELYDVEIYTYCLMPNHFHLQLKTKLANISKFMQSFLTSFTIIINRRYGKCGHLFQGRYKSILIDSELYSNKLSRYIHLNPVKIKGFENKEIKELKNILENYKWSSLPKYLGIEKKSNWLNRNHILSSWGTNAKAKIENYSKYIEKGLISDNNKDFSEIDTGMIGSESFKDKIIRKFLIKNSSDLAIDVREQPQLAKVNMFEFDNIIQCVMLYYKIDDKDKIIKDKSWNNEAKKIAIYLSAKHCRKKYSLSKLAQEFALSLSGYNSSRVKFSMSFKKDKEVLRKVIEIEKILQKNIKK